MLAIAKPSPVALVVASIVAFAAMPAVAQQVTAPGTSADDGSKDGPDWSVDLRGAYKNDSQDGVTYKAILAPEASLTRANANGSTSLGAGAAFSVDQDKSVGIDDLHANAAATFQLNEVTGLRGTLDMSLIQLDSSDSTLPANTLTPPYEFTGTAQGVATRKFGQFDLTGTLTGQRFVEGKTTLDDMSVVDNSSRSYWLGGAELRLGYEVTPLLSAFIDGTDELQKYDVPDPVLLTTLDGRTLTLRGGVSYARDGVISAEASVGRGWLDYADPAIADSAHWVADASVSFTPDETTTLAGTLETRLEPSNNTPGDTDVVYTLAGIARYEVNPWLTLRGSAGADRTLTLGNGALDWSYGLGAGVDFGSSRRVVWSADYLFTHENSSTDGITDTHQVTVGMRVKN